MSTAENRQQMREPTSDDASFVEADVASRLKALRRYRILDTPRERRFDDFTWLAARVCDVPIAIVTLLDDARQWFKSEVGLGVRETPIEVAFCRYTVMSDEVLEVPDALEDDRFKDNPLVLGEPHMRFYAGAPLIAPGGLRIGSMAVIDRKPRRLTQDQREALQRLARQVVHQLELRLVNLKLEATQGFLEAAMAVNDMAPWEHDLEEDVFRFNDRFYDLLATTAEREGGYEMPTEVYQREFFPDGLGELVNEGVENAMTASDTSFIQRFEHQVVRRDGEVRDWTVAFGIERNESGTTIRTFGANQDVTERKRAERELRRLNSDLEGAVQERTEALRSEQQRTHFLLENLAEGVIACDTGGRIIAFNRVAREWHGVDIRGRKDDPSLRQDYELLRADGVSTIPFEESPLTRALADEEIRDEQVILAVEGRPPRHLLVSGGPVFDDEDTKLGAVIVFRDVTQAREAEARARTALLALDAASDGAMIVNVDTLKPIYANRAAIHHSGRSREELLSMTLVDLVVAADEEAVRRVLAPTLEGKTPSQRVETRYEVPGGPTLILEVDIARVEVDEGEFRLIVILRDVSKRIERQKRQNRAQRLESIGTLAAGIAHDLNNTIAPVMMATELLRTAGHDDVEILDIIDSSARRGADMVRQLLTFAKGADGERVAVQLAHLLKEIERLMRASFPKDISVRTDFDRDLPTIIGDPTQMHQLLLNLCVNARDAMENGGSLEVTARVREIDDAYADAYADANPGRYIELRVADTGTGIEPEIMERIFEPFVTTKQLDQGTGLGLSTALGIVRGHGGFLTVQSDLGEGSTFSAFLPIDDPDADATDITEDDMPAFQASGELILVVDDEQGMRRLASAALKSMNLRVVTARDGTDALLKVSKHRNELRAVVTDLRMPNMDGPTFIGALQRILPDVSVVVTSGRMDGKPQEALGNLRIDKVLEKPFSPAQLATTMAEILGDDAAD